jgi:hypothetical protein
LGTSYLLWDYFISFLWVSPGNRHPKSFAWRFSMGIRQDVSRADTLPETTGTLPADAMGAMQRPGAGQAVQG